MLLTHAVADKAASRVSLKQINKWKFSDTRRGMWKKISAPDFLQSMMKDGGTKALGRQVVGGENMMEPGSDKVALKSRDLVREGKEKRKKERKKWSTSHAGESS